MVCIWTKLPSIRDRKWHGISMTICVIFFTGLEILFRIKFNLPCTKCDGFSWKFQVMSCDKSTAGCNRNPHQIPCLFHVIYPGFVFVFHAQTWDGFWMDQVQVMGFSWHLLRKWWDFPCGFDLIFEPNQTAVEETWESSCHIFYRVEFWYYTS